jgi:hypothetical protein
MVFVANLFFVFENIELSDICILISSTHALKKYAWCLQIL